MMRKVLLVVIIIGVAVAIFVGTHKPVEFQAMPEEFYPAAEIPEVIVVSAEAQETREKRDDEGVVSEDSEEAAVDAFDALVDAWMNDGKPAAEAKDANAFVAAYRKLPTELREECVQRAINLIPDKNVILLVGLLFDSAVEKDCREAIFNDILNRDDAVKMPILKEILKDRNHPCREDAAWVLEAVKAT